VIDFLDLAGNISTKFAEELSFSGQAYRTKTLCKGLSSGFSSKIRVPFSSHWKGPQ
jgi:hypothetical protein